MPIHENEMHELEAQVEADMVFYSKMFYSSTTELLSSYNKDSSAVLAEDSCDSGVANSDQDNSVTSNSSPPNTTNDQPLVFNVSFSPNKYEKESTEC